jgi:hypothetical protein
LSERRPPKKKNKNIADKGIVLNAVYKAIWLATAQLRKLRDTVQVEENDLPIDEKDGGGHIPVCYRALGIL